MTQPDYVPLNPADRVRPSERLSISSGWRQSRPADLVDLQPPRGRRFGHTGPDLGYGLKLAKRFEDRIILVPAEAREDAVAGCFACGCRRAAVTGRAPVIYDMEWAYALWGYLGGAPEELVWWRAALFKGASHHYWDQREIVDSIREEALVLTPQQVRERLADWRQLINAD